MTIHTETWWQDIEADNVCNQWLSGTSKLAQTALIHALQHPTSRELLQYQNLIKILVSLPNVQWNIIYSKYQTLYKLEDQLYQVLYSDKPETDSDILFTKYNFLTRWNESSWFHQFWTCYIIYLQPFSTFFLPIFVTILQFLFYRIFGKLSILPFQTYIKHICYQFLGIDIIINRHCYSFQQFIFLLLRKWITVWLYFYSIWNTIYHSYSLQKRASGIFHQFHLLNEWFQTIQSFAKDIQYPYTFDESIQFVNQEFGQFLNTPPNHFLWPPTNYFVPAQCWASWARWKRIIPTTETFQLQAGKLLAIFHLASLVRKQTQINPIGFANWDTKKSYHWKQGWHPSFLGQSVQLQGYKYSNKRRFTLIMGPNASGKTTFLKMASWIHWMAQAWGICPATNVHLQWVEHFWSWVRVPDQTGKESMFEAEVKRAQKILDCLKQINHETAWVWMDEVFGSTNWEESNICAYTTLKQMLKQHSGVIGGCTTHMKWLSKLKHGIRKIHFPMIYKHPNWIPSYHWEKGIGKQNLALQWIKQKKYMSDEWNQEAQKIYQKRKKCAF